MRKTRKPLTRDSSYSLHLGSLAKSVLAEIRKILEEHKAATKSYCDNCRKKNNWPYGLCQSFGRCEACDQVAMCFDVHHSHLYPESEIKSGERDWSSPANKAEGIGPPGGES